MPVSLSITQLQNELDGLNTAINTYLATGVLPVAFSIPTGHSLDAKDCLPTLYRMRRELLELINQMDVPYVTSALG